MDLYALEVVKGSLSFFRKLPQYSRPICYDL